MPSIVVEGFEIQVYTNDHAPAHVHVYRNGAMLKITLGDENGTAEMTGRMSRTDERRARRIVSAHRDELLALWRKYHA